MVSSFNRRYHDTYLLKAGSSSTYISNTKVGIATVSVQADCRPLSDYPRWSYSSSTPQLVPH